jgi:hypothetical protein
MTLCKSGVKKTNLPPKLYKSNAKFITCYRCIKLVEGAARANPARRNPLTEERVFSPSYEALSQEEYNRHVDELRALALAQGGRDPFVHYQIEGGRRAARFGEYGPFPRDPKKGGPRREGGKIVGGKASPRDPETAERTLRRLEQRRPPWEARTQSPLVWAKTLRRMGYDIPEHYQPGAPRQLYPQEAKENPTYGKLYGDRTSKLEREIREALRKYHSTQPEREMGLYVPPFVTPLLEAGMPKAAAYELVRRAGGTFLVSIPLTAFAEVTSTQLFGPLFIEAFGRAPRHDVPEGRSELQLSGRGSIEGVGVSLRGGKRIPLVVPEGEEDKEALVAYLWTVAPRGSFSKDQLRRKKLPALRRLAEVKYALGEGESFVYRSMGAPAKNLPFTLAPAAFARDHTITGWKDMKAVILPRSIPSLFSEWYAPLAASGEWQAGMGKTFPERFFFPWVDKQVRALAGGKGEPRGEFLVRFSRARKLVRLGFSSLQHSIVRTEADINSSVRYRTLKNLPLAKLPAVLARLVSPKRDGRRLQPLSSTESLENPMASHWTKQYSKGPYGSSRSLPAARRNRGRPGKGGKKRPAVNADDRPYLRLSTKDVEKLAKKGNKKAKDELTYRGKLRTWQESKSKSKKPKSSAKPKSSRRSSSSSSSSSRSGGKSTYKKDMAECIKLGRWKIGMSHAKIKAELKKAKGKAKPKTQSRSKGRTVSAKPRKNMVTKRRFMAVAKQKNYTTAQAEKIWPRYQAGKGSLAKLLPSKAKNGRRRAASNPKRRNPHRDASHTREALVASPFDYWDETHTREALTNHHRGMRGRSAHASDPWHPVYEQVIGQFSTHDDYAAGRQPVNRRNPGKARKNGKRRANPDAKRAMQAYHNGEYNSLADAWDAIRNGEL